MNEISNHENQLQTALDDDQRKELKLALRIARLKLEINGYKIDLQNAATDEERRRNKKIIETTNQLLLHDLNQLRGLPPQPMQVAQQGNLIFLSFRFFIFFRLFCLSNFHWLIDYRSW